MEKHVRYNKVKYESGKEVLHKSSF